MQYFSTINAKNFYSICLDTIRLNGKYAISVLSITSLPLKLMIPVGWLIEDFQPVGYYPTGFHLLGNRHAWHTQKKASHDEKPFLYSYIFNSYPFIELKNSSLLLVPIMYFLKNSIASSAFMSAR